MSDHLPPLDPITDKAARRAIAGFLLITVLVGAGLEAFGRFATVRLSKTERRIHLALEETFTTVAAPKSKRRVMVIGNSIANDGIDLIQLKKALGPEVELVAPIVEDTAWMDWLYFLERGAKEGWDLDQVVVVCRPFHLTQSGTRGRYAASHLHRVDQAWPIAQRTHRDATGATELAFAGISKFYGFRSELTKIILSTAVPGFVDLGPVLRANRPPPPKDAAFAEKATSDLLELKGAAAALGADLVIAVPPALTNAGVGIVELDQAAKAAGILVIRPFADDAWPADRYTDGFHLAASGRASFTASVAVRLTQLR